jgi:hypothetical protein
LFDDLFDHLLVPIRVQRVKQLPLQSPLRRFETLDLSPTFAAVFVNFQEVSGADSGATISFSSMEVLISDYAEILSRAPSASCQGCE